MKGSGLGETGRGSYHNDNERTQRTCKEYLKFIVANKAVLSDKLKTAADSLDRQSKIGPLTDRQLAYADGMYEKVMSGLGLGGYKPQKNKWGMNFKA